MKHLLSWKHKKPEQVELNAKWPMFQTVQMTAAAARTRFTKYGNHLFMSSHNLGLGPYEKNMFIHSQNIIVRFHKWTHKMCYHLSQIIISSVGLPGEISQSRRIIDFSHTTYTRKYLTSTSFRLFKWLERKKIVYSVVDRTIKTWI